MYTAHYVIMSHTHTRTHAQPGSYHGHFLTARTVRHAGIVLVSALLHQEPVRGVAARGGRHVAHFHVVVVRWRPLCAEFPPVIEAANKEDDAEEGGDGGADGDVENLEAAALWTCSDTYSTKTVRKCGQCDLVTSPRDPAHVIKKVFYTSINRFAARTK